MQQNKISALFQENTVEKELIFLFFSIILKQRFMWKRLDKFIGKYKINIVCYRVCLKNKNRAKGNEKLHNFCMVFILFWQIDKAIRFSGTFQC